MKEEIIILLCLCLVMGVLLYKNICSENYWNPLSNSAFNVSPKFWNYNEIKENNNK
jgi:hypothetical protein